jgi:hypothetical protein
MCAAKEAVLRVPTTATRLALTSAAVVAVGLVAGLVFAATRSAPPGPATSIAGILTGVACQADGDCLAVTSSAAAESWNGTAWQPAGVRLPAGALGGGFGGVACPGTGNSVARCVAVGGYTPASHAAYTVALGDVRNGTAWTPSGLTTNAITWQAAVSCRSATSCLSVGNARSPEGGYESATAYSWNGAAWTQQNLSVPPANEANSFNGVSCVPGSICMVVGGAEAKLALLVYRWDGKSWLQLTAGVPAGIDSPALDSVSCGSAAHCVAVGNGASDSAAFAEVSNGNGWSVTPAIAWPAGSTNPRVTSVSCASPSYCVAVGVVDRSTEHTGGGTGRAAASLWNGKTWTAMAVPAPPAGRASLFSAVSCPRPASCVAVGESNQYNSATGTEQLTGLLTGTSWRLVG